MILRNVERVALYLIIYGIGFGLSAVVSKDVTGALIMTILLGICIGSADVFTGFSENLVVNVHYLLLVSVSCVIAYGLISAVLWNRDLSSLTTWVSAVSFIFIVMCPFFVNAVMGLNHRPQIN